MSEIIETLRALPGVSVTDTPEDMAGNLIDWRRRFSGKARAVVAPDSTEAVSAVMRACWDAGVPVLPQGGNTSMCGGSVPDDSGTAIILSLSRMNRIRSIDPEDDSVTVDAGCVLQVVQEAALDHDRLFPMSLGAEGSCQIGGNIATNAGGTAALRYGNMRDLVLGIEAVLPDGTIWNGLRTLRKNNSGYDLKHLFIGSEGTLGIVTGAALRLFPRPAAEATTLLFFATADAALKTAATLRAAFPGELSALELLSRSEQDIVARHFPDRALAMPEGTGWTLLVEVAGAGTEADLQDKLMAALEAPMEAGDVLDAILASNERQREAIWLPRHSVTEANMHEGMGLTHDIAIPIGKVPEFLTRADALLAEKLPDATPVVVGHLGDGNMHYIAMFTREFWAKLDDPKVFTKDVGHLLNDIAADLGGTFSAEHGIGTMHLPDMARYKAAPELAMMHAIKATLDPKGLMNPGRLLPAQ
ncbi:D-2-hydroxyacid dehydrogenase [Salipiger pallidus]|uniref:D-2-hydroxyacid dehydrogenase n=1 Tax=Salipiger pallidus TaxID=1775170 RepID=A0A8J2ZI35_9RHOB|nr:FAD-binding oxidoreductase [Salipiger pallidus]GGG64995.1 D-2-hydroxyacid dehydrogenase [Salipiger pallidus]